MNRKTLPLHAALLLAPPLGGALPHKLLLDLQDEKKTELDAFEKMKGEGPN